MVHKINKYILAIAVLIVAGILTAPGFAQSISTERVLTPVDRENAPERPQWLINADRLMQLGAYDQAAQFLEMQLDRDPDNPLIKSTLTRCYENGKDYPRLLLFLQRRLQTEPENYILYRDYGRAYLLNGNPDSARVYFFKAAELCGGKVPALRSMVDTYFRFGENDLVVEFVDSVRVLYSSPDILADRLGDALANQGHFGRATTEYLTHMKRDSTAAREGESKIVSMIQFPGSVDTVMAVLADKIRFETGNKRLFNIYGQILVEEEKFDQAFDFFKERDSIEEKSGINVIYFIRQCSRRGHNDQVVKACQYILDTYKEPGVVHLTRFALGDAFSALGQYDSALVQYQAILDAPITPANEIEAHLRMGLLYKTMGSHTTEAKNHLYAVINAVRMSRYDMQARFALGETYIEEANFDSAMAIFTSLDEYELPEDMAELNEYRQAQIFLFQGSFKEATERYRRLMVRYPRGLYVNDAIQYALIIEETQEKSPGQIDLFQKAEYFKFINREDSLEYYLTKICRIDVPTLAPLSYLELGNLFVSQMRLEEAVGAIDSLSELYPDSYYYPYGLKLKADILNRDPKTRAEAESIYKSLLESYGTYPFCARVREILRHNQAPEQS